MKSLVPFAMLACHAASVPALNKPKHILFMMIDDLGWNDVGYRPTSDLSSPTIDSLANEGIRFNRYYTPNLCSPARTSFLSGRYPYNIGMQGVVILNGMPVDMPKNVSTVADRLRQGGFKTGAFGKWDAGMTTWDFTPTCRGFDYFFGFYGPAQDHYTHSGGGLDLRENFEAVRNESGVYSTHLYTQKAQAWLSDVVGKQGAEKTFLYLGYQAMHGPIQAPEEYTKRCSEMGITKENNRDVYCGMMLALDEGIKNVTDTYKSLDIWEDTVLVFAADNGGHVGSSGNNWPLRGEKSSNYEGGVRATAFMHWPGLPNEIKGSESENVIHVSDWLPTFVSGVAGMKLEEDGYPYPLDGVDQWQALTVPGANATRKDVLHEIGGDNHIHQESYFDGQYKIIRYHPCIYHWNKYTCKINDCPLGWTPLPGKGDPTPPPAAENLVNGSNSFENGGTWLFDVINDPLEKMELSAQHPEIVERLTKVLEDLKLRKIDQLCCPKDAESNPQKYFGGVWTPWRGSRASSCNAGGSTAPDNAHCGLHTQLLV